MANRENSLIDITPEVLLKAYACGIFPMAESADDPALYWIEPDMRGIIPLEGFHLPARLARTVRTTPLTVWVDRDFDAVVDGCAEAKPDRPAPGSMTAFAKSIAVYSRTVIAIPSKSTTPTCWWAGFTAFRSAAPFRRKHVYRARDASKIALVHLVARLRAGGYRLLDTQYVTEHLKSFGAVEVAKRRYHRLLEDALVGEADFAALPVDRPVSGEQALAQLR